MELQSLQTTDLYPTQVVMNDIRRARNEVFSSPVPPSVLKSIWVLAEYLLNMRDDDDLERSLAERRGAISKIFRSLRQNEGDLRSTAC